MPPVLAGETKLSASGETVRTGHEAAAGWCQKQLSARGELQSMKRAYARVPGESASVLLASHIKALLTDDPWSTAHSSAIFAFRWNSARSALMIGSKSTETSPSEVGSVAT